MNEHLEMTKPVPFGDVKRWEDFKEIPSDTSIWRKMPPIKIAANEYNATIGRGVWHRFDDQDIVYVKGE